MRHGPRPPSPNSLFGENWRGSYAPASRGTCTGSRPNTQHPDSPAGCISISCSPPPRVLHNGDPLGPHRGAASRPVAVGAYPPGDVSVDVAPVMRRRRALAPGAGGGHASTSALMMQRPIYSATCGLTALPIIPSLRPTASNRAGIPSRSRMPSARGPSVCPGPPGAHIAERLNRC